MIGLLAISVLVPQTVALRDDPRLQQPITLRLVNAPLPEVIPALGKRAGVSAKTVPNLDDLKITVLVKGAKAALVMEKIASTLGAEWSLDGDTYRLRFSNEETTNRGRYITAEDRYLRARAEKQAQSLIQSARSQLATLSAERSNRQGNSGTRRSGDANQDMSPSGRGRSPDTSRISLGLFLANLRPDQSRQLWEGKILAYPILSTQALLGGNGWQGSQMGAVRYQPLDGSLESPDGPRRESEILHEGAFAFSSRPDGDANSGLLPQVARTTCPLICLPRPVEELLTEPFAKSIMAWESRASSSSNQGILDGPMRGSIPANSGRNLGVFLAAIHDVTGATLIADSFRAPLGITATSFASAKEAARTATRQLKGSLKIEDDTIMIRHGGFWRRRLYEVPEVAAKKLEASKATFEDWMTFASSLRAAHWTAFEAIDGPQLRVNPASFASALPLMRFLSSIGAGARQGLLSGQPMRASQLGAGADHAMQAVMGAPLFGGQRLGRGFPLDGSSLGVYGRVGQSGNLQVVFGISPLDGIAYFWEPDRR